MDSRMYTSRAPGSGSGAGPGRPVVVVVGGIVVGGFPFPGGSGLRSALPGIAGNVVVVEEGSSGSVEGGTPGRPVVVVVGGRRPAAITSLVPGPRLSEVGGPIWPPAPPSASEDGPPSGLPATSWAAAPLRDCPSARAGTSPPTRTVVASSSAAAHHTPPISTSVASTAQPIR
ncbi:MAG TPA: hypothetical protein VJS45_13870 [Acidimicrobiia bacterium]|nr:hypothetical protein [Acidimicrobiia bacterium]